MSVVAHGALLLDTDVLSFFFNRDAQRITRYTPHLDGATQFASFVSVAEMRFGAKRRGWGPVRYGQLALFLQRYTIVESTPRVGEVWAQIRAEALSIGRPIERQDAWIAAVAITLNMPLVTHNVKHFAHVPLLRIITEPDP
jgi:predicted nucleic acid-binding protein